MQFYYEMLQNDIQQAEQYLKNLKAKQKEEFSTPCKPDLIWIVASLWEIQDPSRVSIRFQKFSAITYTSVQLSSAEMGKFIHEVEDELTIYNAEIPDNFIESISDGIRINFKKDSQLYEFSIRSNNCKTIETNEWIRKTEKKCGLIKEA